MSPELNKGLCSRHYQRQRRGVPLTPQGHTTCKQCGSELSEPPYGQVPPSYCSKSCQNRASYLRQKERGTRAPRPKPMVDCTECGQTFEAGRLGAMYCSTRCSRRAHLQSQERMCDVDGCDRPYRAKGMCHMHWRRVARAEGRESAPVWSERRRDAWKVRQSLKRGAVDAETFSYMEIFERDGWLCGICEEPVDPLLEYPEPMSRSLDHVVPLARGGSHVRENAQLAHLLCNVRKGDREVAPALILSA